MRPMLIPLFVLAQTCAAGDAPMVPRWQFERIDVAMAGVGGIGAPESAGGGEGELVLEGVSGEVELALLYWHGADLDYAAQGYTGGDSDYDEAGIEFNGVPITGERIGHLGHNNNWGTGNLMSAAAFRADVTALVQGPGTYTLAGLADGAGHSANGASLIVYFDDGNPSNDRRIEHFDGMESNFEPDRPYEGWRLGLPIDYRGGRVEVWMHVADGQSSQTDGTVRFDVWPGLLPGERNDLFFDSPHVDGIALWAGESVPQMGYPRPTSGHGLWDIRRFELNPLFELPQPHHARLTYDGGSDALTLVVLQRVQDADGQPTALVPARHHFGDVAVDSTSTAQAFAFTNLMSVPLTVTGVSASPLRFALGANGCLGQVLQPGQSCSVEATCTPTNALGIEGSLSVAWSPSAGEAGSSRAQLRCNGVEAVDYGRIAISPAQAWLGAQPVGEASAPTRFTVSSIGAEPVSITSTSLRGTSAAYFFFTGNTCVGATLAPGADCSIDVAFRPPLDRPTGSMHAQLRVQFDTDGVLYPMGDVQLAGTAVPNEGAIFKDGFEALAP